MVRDISFISSTCLTLDSTFCQMFFVIVYFWLCMCWFR